MRQDSGNPKSQARLSQIPNPNARKTEGFTLVELLIVLVVIGIAATLLFPSVTSIAQGDSDERAFRMIAGAVTRAQDLAVTTRTSQNIVLDLDGHALTVGSGQATPLPERARIAVTIERVGREESSGRAEIEVDRYGTVEPFSLRVGDAIKAAANPITGILER